MISVTNLTAVESHRMPPHGNAPEEQHCCWRLDVNIPCDCNSKDVQNYSVKLEVEYYIIGVSRILRFAKAVKETPSSPFSIVLVDPCLPVKANLSHPGNINTRKDFSIIEL